MSAINNLSNFFDKPFGFKKNNCRDKKDPIEENTKKVGEASIKQVEKKFSFSNSKPFKFSKERKQKKVDEAKKIPSKFFGDLKRKTEKDAETDNPFFQKPLLRKRKNKEIQEDSPSLKEKEEDKRMFSIVRPTLYQIKKKNVQRNNKENSSESLSFKVHEETKPIIQRLLLQYPEKAGVLKRFGSVEITREELARQNISESLMPGAIVLFLKRDKEERERIRIIYKSAQGECVGSGGYKKWWKTGQLETKRGRKDYLFSTFHCSLEKQEEIVSNIREVNKRLVSSGLATTRVLPKKGGSYQLFQKYERNGSLESFYRKKSLREQPVFPNFSAKIDAMLGVCRSVERLHGKGMVHGDISSGNIFVSENGKLVLGDYDTAKSEEASLSEEGEKFQGAPSFASPERLEIGMNKASDIWALGVVLFGIGEGRGELPSYIRRCEEKAKKMKKATNLQGVVLLLGLSQLKSTDIQKQYQEIPSRENPGYRRERKRLKQGLLAQERAEREWRELLFDMHQCSSQLRPEIGEVVKRLEKIQKILFHKEMDSFISEESTESTSGRSSHSYFS